MKNHIYLVSHIKNLLESQWYEQNNTWTFNTKYSCRKYFCFKKLIKKNLEENEEEKIQGLDPLIQLFT